MVVAKNVRFDINPFMGPKLLENHGERGEHILPKDSYRALIHYEPCEIKCPKKRSSSFSGFDSFKEKPLRYCEIYQVEKVNKDGGELRRYGTRHLTATFNVRYTTFANASFNIADVAKMIYPGDYVVVSHLYPFFENRDVAWRVGDLRLFNTLNPNRPFDKTEGVAWNPDVLVIHGRVNQIKNKGIKPFVTISTGIENHNVYTVPPKFTDGINEIREGATVLLRARRTENGEKGIKYQPENFRWFADNVQLVGKMHSADGTLKRVPMGRQRAACVIIANKLGYVLVPEVMQKAFRSLHDGARIKFIACANLPCRKPDEKSVRWLLINAISTDEPGSGVQWEGAYALPRGLPSPLLPLPASNVSAVSCRSCKGMLVCVCYDRCTLLTETSDVSSLMM